MSSAVSSSQAATAEERVRQIMRLVPFDDVESKKELPTMRRDRTMAAESTCTEGGNPLLHAYGNHLVQAATFNFMTGDFVEQESLVPREDDLKCLTALAAVFSATQTQDMLRHPPCQGNDDAHTLHAASGSAASVTTSCEIQRSSLASSEQEQPTRSTRRLLRETNAVTASELVLLSETSASEWEATSEEDDWDADLTPKTKSQTRRSITSPAKRRVSGSTRVRQLKQNRSIKRQATQEVVVAPAEGRAASHDYPDSSGRRVTRSRA